MMARRMAELAQAVRDMRSRLALALARGVLRLGDEGHGLRQVQVGLLKGETRDQVEHLEPYGFSAAAHPGAEVVVIFLGGGRDHPVALVTADRRFRPRALRAGDVCIYDDKGQRVMLTRDGIVIDGGGLPITVGNAPKVRMEVDLLEVTGDIKDRCGDQAHNIRQMRDIYNGHGHPDPQGGVVAPPNGRWG